MSVRQVVHHVDYRSKAEDRKRELEKLQQKGLAKTKAARLQDASAPTEACHFLAKQRELFAARRKSTADAMEFLHQYRADDELVLRTAAAWHSLGSKTKNRSAANNSTSRWPLSPSKFRRDRQAINNSPDARASVYSYAVYPICITKEHSSKIKHDVTSDESSGQLPINSPDIDENSISIESTFNALETIAKEASRVPLPDDNDDENNNNNNNKSCECFGTIIQTLQSFVEEEDHLPLPGEDNDDGGGVYKEEDGNGNGNRSRSSSSSNTYLKTALETLQPLVEKAAQLPLRGDDNNDGDGDNSKHDSTFQSLVEEATQLPLLVDDDDNNADEEEEDSKHNSILILEGVVDSVIDVKEETEARVLSSSQIPCDGNLPACSDRNVVVDDSSSTPFIPFEAFSRLGESLVMESLSSTHSKDHDDDDDVKFKAEDSDDDSIIPGESFMQLGASMMANDLFSSKDDDEDEDEDEILHTKESEQYSMEKSELRTATATTSTASQISAGSKYVSADVDITEQKTEDDTSSILVERAIDEERAERDILLEDATTSFDNEINEQLEGLCEDKKVVITEAGTPRSIDEDSKIQNENTTIQSDVGFSSSERQNDSDQSVDSGAALGNVGFEIRTPKKSNLTAAIISDCKESNYAERENGSDKLQNSQFAVSEVNPPPIRDVETTIEPDVDFASGGKPGDSEQSVDIGAALGNDEFENKTPEKANLNAGISDNNALNSVDRVNDSDDKLQESENQSVVNDVNSLPLHDIETTVEPDVDFPSREKEEDPEQSVDFGDALGNDEFENKTPEKSNLTAATVVSDDNELNSVDRISDSDKPQESESQSVANDDNPPPVHDTAPSPRRKKKKKEDKSYYPSSSLFVSRQFLSR